MKKFKINTVAAIAVYVILATGLSSCAGCYSYNDTEPSKFVVKKVVERTGMSKMTTYKVLMLDASGLGGARLFFVDSIGKYKPGDVLCLQPCH